MSDNVEKREVWNGDRLFDAMQALVNGESIASVIGMTQDNLEVLYALGYKLYNSGKYEDAKKVFRALCTYDSTDVRFWIGLGGSLENLKDYELAAQMYAMGCVMTGFNDPEPMFYAAQCFLKNKDKEEAIETLKLIDMMGREGNAHDIEFKDRSKKLRETLESTSK